MEALSVINTLVPTTKTLGVITNETEIWILLNTENFEHQYVAKFSDYKKRSLKI